MENKDYKFGMILFVIGLAISTGCSSEYSDTWNEPDGGNDSSADSATDADSDTDTDTDVDTDSDTDTDTDTDTDPCGGVFCDSPPEPECQDNETLREWVNGTCDEGDCEYEERNVYCEFGCFDSVSGGVCLPDPCAGIICNAPPEDVCSGSHLHVYEDIGTCSGGSCNYSIVSMDLCPFGCASQPGDDYCNGDPCIGVVCDSAPDDVCTGSGDLTVYPTTGSCSGGTCSYSGVTTPCAFGCTGQAGDDVCTPDPCLSTVCDSPPDDQCSWSNLHEYNSTGTCSGAGICNYTYIATFCAGGCVSDAGDDYCDSIDTDTGPDTDSDTNTDTDTDTDTDTTPVNLLVNPGAESGMSGWTMMGSPNCFASVGGTSPIVGSMIFSSNNDACGLEQYVDLLSIFTASQLDSGTMTINVGMWFCSGPGALDDYNFGVRLYDGYGNVLEIQSEVGTAPSCVPLWTNWVNSDHTFNVSYPGARYIRFAFTTPVGSGTLPPNGGLHADGGYVFADF